MRDYVVYFSIYGLHGKATVRAANRQTAEAHVRGKVAIEKTNIRTVLGEMSCEDLEGMEDFMDKEGFTK